MIPKRSHTMPRGTWSSRFSVHIENSDRAIRDQTMITSGTRKTTMRRESEAMLKNHASEGPASLAAMCIRQWHRWARVSRKVSNMTGVGMPQFYSRGMATGELAHWSVWLFVEEVTGIIG